MHPNPLNPFALVAAAAVLATAAPHAPAAELLVSIGLRETGGDGPAFANGGGSGGLEWVNVDGQTLTTDGSWQLFTFTPSADPLSPFAGATANGVLEDGLEWAVLEHVRIRNANSITNPIRLWIDDLTNTDSSGPSVEGFESFDAGTEVVFQEPNFSGSTAGNLVAGGTSLVTDTDAFAGTFSNEINLQFVDGDPTRWVRLTTFNTPNVPNPLVRVVEPGAAAPPTISFYAKAEVIPEPGTTALALAGLGLGLVASRRRRRA